jgi:hypothetical protein
MPGFGKQHHNFNDLSGQRFGRLTALCLGEKVGKTLRWFFSCDCGGFCEKAGPDVMKDVRAGRVPNCGCLTKQMQSEARRSHGMSKHPAYPVWRSMNDRCRLPTHPAWANYGGRGITVCRRWQSSFENFWSDMGASYARGLDLDRRDNEQGYSPENCRWVSRRVNSNNTRANHRVETPAGRMTINQAAEVSGIGRTTIAYRVSNGWPPERLFDSPSPTNRAPSTTL